MSSIARFGEVEVLGDRRIAVSRNLELFHQRRVVPCLKMGRSQADRGLFVKWGTGSERGSFNPKLVRGGTVYKLMSVWNWTGEIQISFEAMREPPFNTLDRRREFCRSIGDGPRLEKVLRRRNA